MLSTEDKLKCVEFEREILAEALAWGAGNTRRPWWQHLPWLDAKKKWLEYAKREARRRAGCPVPRKKEAAHV